MRKHKRTEHEAIAGSPAEAGRRFGISPRRLRRLVAQGLVPSYTTPESSRRIVFFRDIEQLVLAGRVELPSDEISQS